ncbi:hypothetical protein EDC96DRAFT_581153 [Choanephora cucurbitarum]|nr:hypothetical protein EDC96DRAFT_581153 [Choanephora cucurbitarum]
MQHTPTDLPKVPTAVGDLSKRLDEVALAFDEDGQDCLGLLEDEIFNAIAQAKTNKQQEVLHYARILFNLLPSVGQWSKTELGETSFIDAKFNALALGLFGRLDASLYNCTRQAMQKSVQKPDFCLSINTSSGECLEIYQMEAKTPNANKGNVDFLKLANNMKAMVDEMVSRGCPVEDAKSFGTLLHGDTAIYYQMQLIHDGMYIMKEVGLISLPQAASGFGLMVQNIQCLLYIKESTTAMESAVEALKPEKAQHLTKEDQAGKLKNDFLRLSKLLKLPRQENL